MVLNVAATAFHHIIHTDEKCGKTLSFFFIFYGLLTTWLTWYGFVDTHMIKLCNNLCEGFFFSPSTMYEAKRQCVWVCVGKARIKLYIYISWFFSQWFQCHFNLTAKYLVLLFNALNSTEWWCRQGERAMSVSLSIPKMVKPPAKVRKLIENGYLE